MININPLKWVYKPSAKQRAVNELIERNRQLLKDVADLRNENLLLKIRESLLKSILKKLFKKNKELEKQVKELQYNQRDAHGCYIRNKK